MRVFKYVLVACFVMLISVVPMVFGASVGVKVGDWVKYEVSASGNVSEGFGDFDQTEWMKGEVLSVSGTNVTMQITAHYKNGSADKVDKLIGDIAGSSGNLSFILVPAGLKAGDAIPMSMFGSNPTNLVINDTVSRTYAGASRSVNHFGMSASGSGYSVEVAAYWDQATGVLMELSMSTVTPEENMQVSIKATETNMWSSGLFGTLSNPILIISIASVIIVAIAAVIILMTRRPKPIPAPAMPPANVPATENPT